MSALTSYTLQTWNGERRIHDDLTGLSIDAGREIARAHTALGYTVRLWPESPTGGPKDAGGPDYYSPDIEVYEPDGSVRRGTWQQTTRVIIVPA